MMPGYGNYNYYNKKRKKKKEKPISEDAKNAKELRKKHRDELTNQELRKLNERTMLENQYKQLNPSAFKKGMAVAGTAAAAMGTIVTLYSHGDKLIKIGKDAKTAIVDKVGDMVISDINKHL